LGYQRRTIRVIFSQRVAINARSPLRPSAKVLGSGAGNIARFLVREEAVLAKGVPIVGAGAFNHRFP
jgi:hypothetical protein